MENFIWRTRKKSNGEAEKVAEYTVSAWMQRLMELTRGYELADIWNMDETGCFFKALPEEVLLKIKVKPEERKNKKQG